MVTAGYEDIIARRVVNAAGLFSDDVARMIGDDSFTVRPRKGEYLLMDRSAKAPRYVIFQTPSHLGKGILVSPTVDGNSFVGPTAVDQTDKTDTSVSQEGIDQLRRMAKKSAPEMDFRNVITSFAGLRAQPSTGDFIIRPSEADGRMIHAAGICSPGLTSAPAVAELVEKLLMESGLTLTENAAYRSPPQPHSPVPGHDPGTERKRAIAENPLYARVICRCETITEAEIVEAVQPRAPAPWTA